MAQSHTKLTAVTAVAGDFIPFLDATDGAVKKANASDFLGGGAGLTFARIIKIADETVNNSSTIQDDDELFAALNANKVYHMMIMICWNSGTTPDFKYQISIPSGATADRSDGTWNQISSVAQDWTAIQAPGGQGSTVLWTETHGRIETGGTAGNVTFQWAQNVANASDTKVRIGSMMLIWEEA